jgi:hypothetical protein
MKLKAMKRSIMVLAAAFATMSISALAENNPPMKAEPMVSKSVQLSDVELDGITAGTTTLILVNPGNHSVFKENKNHNVCINCAGTPPSTGPAFGQFERPGQEPKIIGRPHFPF